MVGRRLLGLDAAFCVALGLGVAIAARPLGRALRLPGWSVAIAGIGSVGWGIGVGVSSVAEDWIAPTRRVAVANTGAAAALVGLAAARGSFTGRVGSLLVGSGVGAFAYLQVKALVAERGPIIA